SSQDGSARSIQDYVMGSLLEKNNTTYEWEPGIAKSWTISKDGMTFEFKLDPNAKFHDGKPVTADDVKFTFDAIMDKSNKYKTAHRRSYFENFEGVNVIDKHTVQFKAKDIYWGNFDVAAGFAIVPKHVYENTDEAKTKKLNR